MCDWELRPNDQAAPTGMSYTPERFVEDAVSIISTEGATDASFAKVADKMRELAQQPGLLDDTRLESLHGSGSTATILTEGKDGSCALMLARFPHEAPTPVHNHNSWGLACVVKGRDRYERWVRRDDGSNPTKADLVMAEERIMEPGDVIWFHEPPQDIHRQQGYGEAAYELVLFGKNPNLTPRAYFDEHSGAVTYADAAGSSASEER